MRSDDQKEYFFLKGLDKDRIPRHVAVIMDGNGRWAKKRGLPRVAGHRAGYEAVRDVVETAKTLGIGHLTLYAFSAENWKRPKDEVDSLMDLFAEVITAEAPSLNENDIKLDVIGRLDILSSHVRTAIEDAESLTEKNGGLNLVIALNYGGRSEIIDAVKKIAEEVDGGLLKPGDVSEETLAQNLYLPDLPDPELVIRTSGEERISNFLIWQAAYSEFWTTKKLWPDFRGDGFVLAIVEFQKRERRFGGIGEI
ncbi:MAG: isoprenyl transferase [Actinomycetota bacterium]|nr:isoprenyl transferase [Actinomycetota bacterium]